MHTFVRTSFPCNWSAQILNCRDFFHWKEDCLLDRKISAQGLRERVYGLTFSTSRWRKPGWAERCWKRREREEADMEGEKEKRTPRCANNFVNSTGQTQLYWNLRTSLYGGFLFYALADRKYAVHFLDVTQNIWTFSRVSTSKSLSGIFDFSSKSWHLLCEQGFLSSIGLDYN